MKFRSDNSAWVLFLTAFLVFADQLSKYIVRSQGGFYICNPTLAFGIEINTSVFYFLCPLLLLLAFYAVVNSKSKILNPNQIQNPNDLDCKKFWILNFVNFNLFGIWNLEFGILLILSGALANIVDRIRYGCVIDFIDLGFWPIFNLADVFITAGAILLIISLKAKD